MLVIELIASNSLCEFLYFEIAPIIQSEYWYGIILLKKTLVSTPEGVKNNLFKSPGLFILKDLKTLFDNIVILSAKWYSFSPLFKIIFSGKVILLPLIFWIILNSIYISRTFGSIENYLKVIYYRSMNYC